MRAQDSLMLSLQGQRDAQAQRQQIENQPYTVRWGEMRVLAGGSIAGEWNDNVNISHFSPQEDFIVRPMGNLAVFWPVTDQNSLNFTIGAGYEKYIRHDQYDRVVVTPGSQLSWDFKAGDITLNLHDQFSYYDDPTVHGAVSGTARFGGFNNAAGLLASWDLHDVTLALGYDHNNFISSTSTYDYLNRASDFALFRASFQVHPSAVAGLEVTGGPTDYDKPTMQDNLTYSIGAFAQWQITEHLKVEPRGGYYTYVFSDSGGRVTPDQNGYYASVKFSHEVRRNITYSLEAGRETYFGVYSALTEIWYGTAAVSSRVIRNIIVSPSLRYETATQPLLFRLSDNYDRISADLRISCPLKERLIASIEYRYWLKKSELFIFNDYEQNRVTLQLAYNF